MINLSIANFLSTINKEDFGIEKCQIQEKIRSTNIANLRKIMMILKLNFVMVINKQNVTQSTIARFKRIDMQKTYDKTEEWLKATQSMGQIIGEV